MTLKNTKIERYLGSTTPVLTTTNAYDIYGRLNGITQKNSSGVTIADSTYGFDNLSRLISETKDSVNRVIAYDKIDQVKAVTGSNSEAYNYDFNGNRTNVGYATGINNQLNSDGTYNYQYDAEGNRIQRTKISDNSVDTYAWDHRNRLTTVVSKTATGIVTQTVVYEYDIDDQRIGKTINGVVEKYYLDGEQIAFVTDAAGNQLFHYLYGLNVDAVMAQDSPTGMVWSLADRLGTVDTLTDGSGVVIDKRNFDSFGRVLSETNPSVKFRYGYTGREQDKETGLDYYRARYYDPANGRFISVDPAGFGAGDTNLYRYVGNRSTMYTDPSGKIAIAALPLALIIGVIAIGFIGTSNEITNNSGAIGNAIGSGADGLGRTFNDSVANVSTFGNSLRDSIATNANTFGRTLNGSVNAGTKAFNKAVNFWGSGFSNFSGFDLTNIGNNGLLEHFPTNPGEIPLGIPGFDLISLGNKGLIERFPTNPGEIPLGIPGFDLDSGMRFPQHTGHGKSENLFIPYFSSIWDDMPFEDREEMDGYVLPESKQIAQGHAWEKHAENLGVTNQYDLAKQIDYVISNPSHQKNILRGRKAYYDIGSNILVIVDPHDDADSGTTFKPEDGFEYYDKKVN